MFKVTISILVLKIVPLRSRRGIAQRNLGSTHAEETSAIHVFTSNGTPSLLRSQST